MMTRYVWSADEIEYLKKSYPLVCGKIISKKLGITYSQMVYQARKLGLKKDYKFLLDSSKRLLEASINTRFKKGCVAINKGKKQTEYMSTEAIQRAAATRFKKGSIPHNSLPVGSEVLRYDKRSRKSYFMIKVEGCTKLVYKHVHIFETHWNLKLKPGENVVFKDGNTANFSIENLECITNVELMKRNTIQRFPAELKTQMVKNSRLKKIIKKLENGTKN
jgi:hypothetical protein